MRGERALLALIAAFTFAVTQAAERRYDFDDDELLDSEKSGWKEAPSALPPFPRAENLIEVQMGPAASHRYYIDAKSVSLGTDGVMRYSAVIRTSGGASNVSFEGIRCETRERKVYALGHADGTWAKPRESAWRRIERHHLGLYFTLWRDYFCTERTSPTRPARAIDAIRRGEPLASPGN